MGMTFAIAGMTIIVAAISFTLIGIKEELSRIADTLQDLNRKARP